jgi:P pilus assembly chaperone PapD
LRTSQPVFLWVALLTLGLFACQQAAEEGEETTPAETTEIEEAPAPEVMSYTLVVSNPMPHAMNVTAMLADGSQVQLGTVPASGEGTFTVSGAAGETVVVTATDEAATHSPSGSLTLPAGETTVSWTVQ